MNRRLFAPLVTTALLVVFLLNSGEAVPIQAQMEIPKDVMGNTVTSIAAGWGHTCAINASGAMCWGSNCSGKLGDGTTTDRPTPIYPIGLSSGVSAISSGFGDHSCALMNSGGVKCWGLNTYGQLGDGTRDYHLTAVDVMGLNNGVMAIGVGSRHTCALMNSGGVKCWGERMASVN